MPFKRLFYQELKNRANENRTNRVLCLLEREINIDKVGVLLALEKRNQVKRNQTCVLNSCAFISIGRWGFHLSHEEDLLKGTVAWDFYGYFLALTLNLTAVGQSAHTFFKGL
jgi:hypothetical protein